MRSASAALVMVMIEAAEMARPVLGLAGQATAMVGTPAPAIAAVASTPRELRIRVMESSNV